MGKGGKKKKSRTSDKSKKPKSGPKSGPKTEYMNVSKSTAGGGNSDAQTALQQRVRAESSSKYTNADLLKKPQMFQEIVNGSNMDKTILMVKKLRLCCIVLEFSSEEEITDDGTMAAKANKRQHLLDLIDHITTSPKWFCEEVVPFVLEMVSSNLFRSLPPIPYLELDPEIDEPALDPQWPHLQLVYEFLLRFVVSAQTEVRILRKYLKKDNKRFICSVIHLFESDDPREREYLKTILHRIYGKFMAFRSSIRKQINYVFYRLIFEEQAKHSGVSELLEILGSIINGFALPLKKEHVKFLETVLIPLHKVRTFPQFSQQLAWCVTQFIDKDPTLASTVIRGLLIFWPRQNATKEQLFLNELEEVLEASTATEVTKMLVPLFAQVAKCISSPHFQVAERALFLWNNEAVAQYTNANKEKILPIIYPSLNANTQMHWNATVHSLAFNIIRLFMQMDVALWDQVSKEFEEKAKLDKAKKQARASKWEKLRQTAELRKREKNARGKSAKSNKTEERKE